ncbi:MAG: site-2 protease family protein [Candidatus Eremiobacteraeota bacterium]|nr:site-2 protease family protein [Candidatus Eremiobacteraeota bacterium]MBC5827240.1 site-2 protease family protein [Candidatus Eremiobacteraeota bacterium]
MKYNPEEPQTYSAPLLQQVQERRARRGTVAGIGATLIALAAKFKGVLLLLLKFKWVLLGGKFLLSGGSLVLSIVLWAQVFGWPFAAGFVLLIFVHEMGHVFALRARGISASVPIFIPFMGAFVAMKEMPPDAKVEAYVALAGPLVGTAGAAACYLIGLQTGARIWYALASAGFFVNLFNMLPVIPLDGGRVVAALSPKLWVVGLAALLVFAVLRPGAGLLFVGFLIFLSLPRVVSAFKPGALDQPYYRVAARDRLGIGLQYFGLAAFQAIMWAASGAAVHVGVTPQ